jgi:lysozyme family protein
MNNQFDQTDPLFSRYIHHVLKWEGKTSKDPRDTAASCAPFKGAFHTNKGVTYCTFRKLAAGLGIVPVTYQRFLQLSTEDVTSFVYAFCKAAEASELDTRLGLSITEAAWLSGPYRAKVHLQEALNSLGQKVRTDGDIGPKTLAAIAKVAPDTLYKEYWTARRRFLDRLTSYAKYAPFKNGWNARIADFLRLFPIT